MVSSSHDVSVPCCGVMASPTGLHSCLFCMSCLNIQCAEAKLNKNNRYYALFKRGAFVRELGLLCPEGLWCPCQQAAWPSRGGSVEPGAWCWGPDVHSADVQTSSRPDLWTGHPAVARGQAVRSCSVSPGFSPSEGKPSCSGSAPCCKEEDVVSGHSREPRFKSVVLSQSQTRWRYSCRVLIPCSGTKGLILS